MLKKELKRWLLRRRGIRIDRKSNINYGILLEPGFITAKVVDSPCLHITSMGDGCTLDRVTAYGDIRLGRFVSISGPGTVLHAVDGKIEIGSFCSIGQNVSIQQFNHDMNRPSTYGIQHQFFTGDFKDDVNSKGDIVIEDDVWIGSNASILSGVTIGRGAVIAAGAVVNKDVEPYAVYGGVPARKIKMRFSEEQIKFLENIKWWKWSRDIIMKNRGFFLTWEKPMIDD